MKLITFFILFIISGIANASLITIDEVIDISGHALSSFYGMSSVTIATGDSVDMTVNFDPGQAMHIGDGNEYFYAWMDGASTSNNFTITNIVLEFLGFTGGGGASSIFNLTSQSSGSAHIGSAFSNFLSSGQYIEFTGYNVSYDVTAMSAGSVDYSNVWFINGGDDTYVTTSSVPEPTSLALLGLGLAGVGFSKKKEKRLIY